MAYDEEKITIYLGTPNTGGDSNNFLCCAIENGDFRRYFE